MRAVTLCLTLLLACLLAASPAQALEQTLVASDGQEDDYFGWDVAVDGDTAVVGATTNFDSAGHVYVFTRDGDVWKQTARLQGSDTESGDHFGQTVAIDGDTIVVGAPYHPKGTADLRAGAVYTFARTGAPNRAETAKLTLPAPATTNAAFGGSVAIDGDVIAASAPAEGSSAGAVYLFDRTGASGRAPRAKLTAGDGASGDGLGEGNGLAIDGDTVVAGAKTKPDPAPGPGTLRRGAAYTFDATTTGISTSTDKLEASDAQALDFFGRSVDVDDETIVVGASADSFPGRNYVGSAYTFENSDDHPQTSKLVTSDGKAEDRAGWDVAVGGAQIAVAADLDDHGNNVTNEGTVYLYPRSSSEGERFETSRFLSATPARHAGFGFSVDMDGTTLIAGENSADVGANSNQGTARISFAPATAPACSDGGDNDGDGKIDYPEDPGCESPDDTSEADPPPPPPGTGQQPPANAPGGAPPGVQGSTDDGSKAPRIIRPRTQAPVTPSKQRTIKFATVWGCIGERNDEPCKGHGWITIAYIADDEKPAKKSAKKKRKKPKRLQIASSRTTIPSGATKPFTVKLTKKGYVLLRKRKKLKARVEMRLSRTGTKTVSTSFGVTIKAPKAARKKK